MDSLAGLDETVARHLAVGLVARLLHLGLYDALAKGASAAELAGAIGEEPSKVTGAIAFAVRFSGLLKTEPGERVRFSDVVLESDTARFRMLKFLGAYAPTLATLGTTTPADGLLALAYRQLSRRSPRGLVAYLQELGPKAVLEIGCGSAPVLRALAAADPTLRGLAADRDPAMAALARDLVAEQQLSDRVKVTELDLWDVANAPPKGWAAFDVVVLRSVLNDTFACEGEAARVLRKLAATYPGARFVVCEYLSQLGRPPSEEAAVQTLTHDLVQVLSGQGLPPAGLEAWDDIYAAAGLQRRARRIDESLGGVTQFIDLIDAGAQEAAR